MNAPVNDLAADAAKSGLSEQVGQNLEALVAFRKREWQQRSTSERRVEKISRVIGHPMYLAFLAVFTAAWIIWNTVGPHLNRHVPDPFPFPLLDGILTFAALVNTVVVLVAQRLQEKLERQHAHLALQVNILTEQKVTKIIHLLEELRHDMPMVKDRRDDRSEVLKQSADTTQVLTAIEQAGLTGDNTSSPRPPGPEASA